MNSPPSPGAVAGDPKGPSPQPASRQAAPLAMGRAGQIFELKSGRRSVLVTEEGAGLFSINWDGTELLDHVSDDGFGGDGAHGQILAPWPGRVSGGTYSYEGKAYQLPLDDHTHCAAIHGFVRWMTWAPARRDPTSLTLVARLLGHPGYPFCFDFEQSYTWLPDRLALSFRATNVGQRPAPFGYGCHPYFTVGLPRVDAGVLRAPAKEYLEVDEHLNPLPPPRSVEGGPFDFREPRPIGDAHLDLTLTGLERDAGGEATVTFASPDGARVISCHYGPAVKFVQLFSGDTLPTGQRQGLAIEPYTCAPNAFNNGLGLLEVAPGETVEVDWSISARLG